MSGKQRMQEIIILSVFSRAGINGDVAENNGLVTLSPSFSVTRRFSWVDKQKVS